MKKSQRKPCRKQRPGTVTIEATIFIGTVFIIAMLLYWIAQSGFVGLYQIIAGHVGSPYL